MRSCKKAFFLYVLFFLTGSCVFAAYRTPDKFDDYALIEKVKIVGNSFNKKEVDFWTEIKSKFNNNYYCDNRVIGYLTIIEVLFERALYIASNQITDDKWKNEVIAVFEKNFTNGFAHAAAFVSLRKIILSSRIFNELEGGNLGENEVFWYSIQNVYKKDQSIHRLLSFGEIIIFLKTLYVNLSKKGTKLKNEDLLFEASKVNKWLTLYHYDLGTTKESLLLEVIKDFWVHVSFDLWPQVNYKLIENFCVSSQFFKDLEK